VEVPCVHARQREALGDRVRSLRIPRHKAPKRRQAGLEMRSRPRQRGALGVARGGRRGGRGGGGNARAAAWEGRRGRQRGSCISVSYRELGKIHLTGKTHLTGKIHVTKTAPGSLSPRTHQSSPPPRVPCQRRDLRRHPTHTPTASWPSYSRSNSWDCLYARMDCARRPL
jgi:hypothetical protein